jgi:hypothetical protein
MSNTICITHALGVFVACMWGLELPWYSAGAFMHCVYRNVMDVSGRRSGCKPASACIIGRICRLTLTA